MEPNATQPLRVSNGAGPVHVRGPLEELLLDLLEPALARAIERSDDVIRKAALRSLVGIVSQLHGHRRLDAIGHDVVALGVDLIDRQRDLDVLVAGELDDVRELAGRWPR